VLRRVHVHPFLRERDGRLTVVPLADPGGAATALLGRLCRLVRRLEGAPRRTVAEALARQERRVRDVRRLAGVSKALLDACEFRPAPDAARAAAVRDALFAARAAAWPPTSPDDEGPYEAAAAALGLTPDAVRHALYADAPGAAVLAHAPALDGAALLARYHLELARAVLLDATRVTITAHGGWRGIFRAVKLARLMYRVERAGRRGWRVELTGPAAAFVARPQRYGARLARVVPALARAPGWRLEAEVARGGGTGASTTATYTLDAATLPGAALGAARQTPKARPATYDSGWERALARDVAATLRAARAGAGEDAAPGRWTLLREATPVPVGDAAGDALFLPDFTLRHTDGREALVEVVGFWTPEYLADKLRKVAAAGRSDLVLVVYRGLGVGTAGAGFEAELGALEAAGAARVVWFRDRPRAAPVLAAAEAVARVPERVAGGTRVRRQARG